MRPFIVASGISLALALATASPASAQEPDPFDTIDDKKPAEGQPAEGQPKEEESDPSLFEGENPGEDENPGDPTIDLVGDPVVKKKVVVRPPGYPQEVYHRPLTLPGGMAQASFDYRFQTEPQGDGIVGAHYAINSQLQLGLRYGIGSVSDDGYDVGKTFAIDAEYTIMDWIAAQLSIPMLADPYTVGVTIGAPMKFTFRDKLRFDLGRDLITFRTNRDYYPRLGNARATAAQVAADETNTILDQGEIKIAGGVTYQHSVKMAAELRFGVTLADFELTSDSPYLFEAAGTYAHTQNLDLGATLGFSDLGRAGDTFGVGLFARFRLGG